MNCQLAIILSWMLALGPGLQNPVRIPGPGGKAAVSSNTFTLVQHLVTACSTASCAVTVTSTGSNHLIVGVSASTNQSITISSVSGGGTWTHCSNCAATQSSSGSSDISYTLSSTSGATTITFTMSGAMGSGSQMEVMEYSFTLGSGSVDTSGSNFSNAQQTPVPGIALTLSGSSDLIVQAMIPSASATGISGGAFSSPDFTDIANGIGFSAKSNTTNGAAPSWSVNATSFNVTTAIAFK